MEYFNTYSNAYINTLKTGNAHYKLRLELLSDDEYVVGDITQDLSLSSQGQITINYEQITRRSCSLTLIDVEDKYVPHKNSPFWINRKFKLWLGVVVTNTQKSDDDLITSSDVYWWSEGVFYTVSAVAQGHTLQVEGVDKGAALDGTLKLNMTDVEYLIERNDNLAETIKQILSLDVGASQMTTVNGLIYSGSKPVDSKQPIIGTQYFTQGVYSQIVVDANNYIGEIFTKLAELYDADCYYDTEGYFKFVPFIESVGYQYVPKQWEFNDLSSMFEDVNYNYSYDGENTVTYYTNSTDTGVANVAWTAYNTNPLSPLNINAGIRRAPSQEIPYYEYSSDPETNAQQMIQDCRAAANHYLLRNSLMGMQLNFNCPIIPHLDVNKTIGITDRMVDIDDGVFIVQSITIPLSADKMNVSATNINWIPNDMDFEGEGQVIEPQIDYYQTREEDYIYIVNSEDSETVKYKGTHTIIKMPETLENKPLTKVGYDTFYQTNIERVIIPDGVTTIE